jgi:type I restriction enzyme, S subunit
MSRLRVDKLGKHTSLISSGSTPLGGSQVYLENGPVLFIRSQNVLMNQLDVESAVYISDEMDRKMGRTRLQPDDVLLNITGASIGRVATFDGQSKRANVNQHVCVIRPDPSVLNARYLSRLIATPAFQGRIQQTQVGGTRQALTFSQIADFEIPLPPLGEQQRIAEVLDRTEDLRSKRRTALAHLDILIQSIFLDLFGDPTRNPKGWTRVAFGELLSKIDSGWSPICLDRPVMGNEWGVLKLGAVTWCEYNPAENKAMLPNVAPDPDLEVRPGDLLFTRKNTYELVAACALVQATPPRLQMSDLIFRFRLRPEANMDECFLHRLLIYPTKRREMQKLAGGSAGSMPNISKARLQNATIEVPPLSIQREFARRVAVVEKLKGAHRASLAELDALSGALQFRAFRGEL